MNRLFDRSRIRARPLAERANKAEIERDAVDPSSFPVRLSAQAEPVLAEAVERIRYARSRGKPVILAFGAHAIKNGLAPVMISLMKNGWLTHCATNGAGIIHDWEFAHQGKTGEDVEYYTSRGQFGIWQETGLYLNLAILAGAYHGAGYGESVGTMIEQDGIRLPPATELREAVRAGAEPEAQPPALTRAAAAADLLEAMRSLALETELIAVDHPYKRYSVQGAAAGLGVPLTAHPMIGHDIIYTHPANRCAAIGRAAERDFLSFVSSISELEGGVYLSVGSAIMSPMIFEKALSMARNVAFQESRSIDNFRIYVVDLSEPAWDWARDGEPPPDNPAYYLRFLKTFSRMGASMRYLGADNRSFLVELHRRLVGS